MFIIKLGITLYMHHVHYKTLYNIMYASLYMHHVVHYKTLYNIIYASCSL